VTRRGGLGQSPCRNVIHTFPSKSHSKQGATEEKRVIARKGRGKGNLRTGAEADPSEWGTGWAGGIGAGS
jgi:hypothetical protein